MIVAYDSAPEGRGAPAPAPKACATCLCDIIRDGDRWRLAWGGSEDPYGCHGGQHEPRDAPAPEAATPQLTHDVSMAAAAGIRLTRAREVIPEYEEEAATPPMALAEACEPVARFLWDEYGGYWEWDKAPERKRDYYRGQAREILDASGLAPAWDALAARLARAEAERDRLRVDLDDLASHWEHAGCAYPDDGSFGYARELREALEGGG